MAKAPFKLSSTKNVSTPDGLSKSPPHLREGFGLRVENKLGESLPKTRVSWGVTDRFPRVGIVGATGAVGQEFRAILSERAFPAHSYRLFASPRSAGNRIEWINGPVRLEALTSYSFDDLDVVFFCAGGDVSRDFVPMAQRSGAWVIDNSSAFRMDPDVPLVVPEINADALNKSRGLVANPNCSTIILSLALWPLHRAVPIRRIVVSTYQAVSGAGARALDELEKQTRGVLDGHEPAPAAFHVPCAFNVFSHNSPIGSDGFNLEERKMIEETRKIFGDSRLAVAPTCMRVPVRRAHLESVNIEFSDPMTPDRARDILAASPGLRVIDQRESNMFPTSLRATGINEVLVGRIRQDTSIQENRGLQFICAGDQLRKGAALNAVQIAEHLLTLRRRFAI